MISFNTLHRVLIVNYSHTKNAVKWCEQSLKSTEWSVEYFDNNDCFYFTSKRICSMFIFVNGGKYIAPPRGVDNG
jgi:hypothetical protein